MSKSEKEYELEAKEYLSHLSTATQKLGIKAINDCLDNGKTWRWITTALCKKGYSNWEKSWHFGLLFDNRFNASVCAQIQREDEAEKYDLEDFFKEVKENQQFSFPNPIDGESIEETKESNELYFYHPLKHGHNHKEEYKPSLFQYYEQILEPTAIELNLPAIKHGLENKEIPEEYLFIYLEALNNFVGDSDE